MQCFFDDVRVTAAEREVNLTNVTGLAAVGEVYAGVPLEFNIGLENTTGSSIVGLIHGFEVYSPDGATWDPIVIDTFSHGWPTRFDLHVELNNFSANGSVSDSAIIGAVSLIGTGFEDAFSDQAWRIETSVPMSDTGLHICIDSIFIPPAYEWTWNLSSSSNYYPGWDGPHCFKIVAGSPPEITNGTPFMSDNHCNTFIYDFDAIDPDGDPYWFEFMSGVGTLDTATGVWSYVPTPADVGQALSVTVQACDAIGCGTPWTMDLEFTNVRPVFTSGCNDTIDVIVGQQLQHQLTTSSGDCDPLVYAIIDAFPYPVGTFWQGPPPETFYFEPDASDIGLIAFIIEVTDDVETDTCEFWVNVTSGVTTTVSYNDSNELAKQTLVLDYPVGMSFTNPSPVDPVTLESISFELYKDPGTTCSSYPDLEVFIFPSATGVQDTLFSQVIPGASVCAGWSVADSVKQIDIPVLTTDTIVIDPAEGWIVGLWNKTTANDTVFLISDAVDTVSGIYLNDECSCWWDSPPRTLFTTTTPLDAIAWNLCFNFAFSTDVRGPSYLAGSPIDSVTWEYYDHFVSGWPLDNDITIDLNENYQDRIDSLVITGPGGGSYVFQSSNWSSDPDYKFTFTDTLMWTQTNSVKPFAILINGTEYHRNCYRCWEKPLRDAPWAATDTQFTDLANPDGLYQIDAAVPKISLSWSDTIPLLKWDFVNTVDLNTDVTQEVNINGNPDIISVDDSVRLIVFNQELFNQAIGVNAYEWGGDPTIAIVERPDTVLWSNDWRIINNATIAYVDLGVVQFSATGDVGIRGDFSVGAKLCNPSSDLCGTPSSPSYGGAQLRPTITPYAAIKATARVLWIVGKAKIRLKSLFQMAYPIDVDGITGGFTVSPAYDFDLKHSVKVKLLGVKVYKKKGTIHLYDEPPHPKTGDSIDFPLSDLWSDSELADNIWYGPSSMATSNDRQALMSTYVHRTGAELEEVYYSRLVNSSWTNPVPVTNSSSPKSNVKVEAYGPSSFAAVWEQHEGAFDTTGFTLDSMYVLMRHQEVIVSRYIAQTGSWSTPVRLTDDSNADGTPAVAGSGQKLSVVWARHDDVPSFDRTAFKIFRAFFNGSSWTAPEPLVASQTGSNIQPTIATDPLTGDAKVVWVHDQDGEIDTPGDRVLLAVTIDTGGVVSSPPDTIPTTLGPYSPIFAIGPSGEQVVCYERWGVNVHDQGDSTITDTVGIGDAVQIGSSLERGTGWMMLDVGDYLTTGYGTEPQVTVDEWGTAHLAYRTFEKGQPGEYDGEIGYTTCDLTDPGAVWTWPIWRTDDTLFTDMGDIACLPGGQVRIQYLSETFPTNVFSAGLDKIYEVVSQSLGDYTVPGNGVPVNPIAGVSIVFDEVYEEGYTTGSVNTSGPELPIELLPVPDDPPAFFNLATTADVGGPIELTLAFDHIEFKGNRSSLSLLQYQGEAWVDITTSVDLPSNTVTGTASELGIFVVATSAVCCVGTAGNVNGDSGDAVDISDLTKLVNHLFVTFEELECYGEANTNGDAQCNVDISDLTKLVNHLFVTFETLAPCNPPCD
ncbi:MAG: hypothetical protein V3T31_06960 [candidate division Zixibacteria bacterium]